MGVNDDFGGNDEGHADEDFGGFEGEGHDAPANEGFADEAFGGSEQHVSRSPLHTTLYVSKLQAIAV
jgi:hypothetical protein